MLAMTLLPVNLHTAAQVRELDRMAIEDEGIPGYTLMNRAGQAAFDVLREAWPDCNDLLIVCGAGNNAGDGYVLARLARDHGLDVTVTALVGPDKLRGDAARAWTDFRDSGGTTIGWEASLLSRAGLMVDAILGTGLDRELTGSFREAVIAINTSPAPVLALDIPSGLHADTGAVMGAAISADHTVTFVGLKAGFYLGAGPDHVGTIHFDGLGVPTRIHDAVPAVAERLSPDRFVDVLAPGRRTAHKGEHGRVLIVGGGPGMPGAVRLCGEAALRSGAGLVTVATHPDHSATIVAGRPELICRPVMTPADLEPLLSAADVVALGPGLGQSGWARSLYDTVIQSDKPLVVDADGLNLLAANPRRSRSWVLTPHPGEAARLLATDIPTVQRDRIAAVRAIVGKYGGVAVLKGAGSLVYDAAGIPAICDRGNPGMATAGMGDVLTGVIAALAARCGNLVRAAELGVLAHSSAGDRAALDGGEHGLIAGDLMEPLRAWFNHPD